MEKLFLKLLSEYFFDFLSFWEKPIYLDYLLYFRNFIGNNSSKKWIRKFWELTMKINSKTGLSGINWVIWIIKNLFFNWFFHPFNLSFKSLIIEPIKSVFKNFIENFLSWQFEKLIELKTLKFQNDGDFWYKEGNRFIFIY